MNKKTLLERTQEFQGRGVVKYRTMLACLLAGTSFGLVTPARAADCSNSVFYTDKDHPGASDANPGTEQAPFATIQNLVDVLGQCIASTGQGKTGRVKRSAQPYFEPLGKPGRDLGGITFVLGGLADDKRLTLEGIPTAEGLPVIDQQYAYDPDIGQPATAFFIPARNAPSYITLRNFELTHTAAPAISIENSVDVEGIIFEGNHIHHLAGPENMGGIRLSNCNHCIVRNNVIHNVVTTRFFSNHIDDKPIGLDAGIHGFEPAYTIIENNLFFYLEYGVYIKRPDRDGGDSHVVRNNYFYDMSDAAYMLNLSGSGVRAAQNAAFYDNIVRNSNMGVHAEQYEAYDQANGLKIYNNTFVDIRSPASIWAMMGVQFFNNIRSGASFDYGERPVDFRTVGPRTKKNEVTFLDCNLYHDRDVGSWVLGDYSAYRQEYSTFGAWQNAFIDNGSEYIDRPDLNSRIADPQFVDRAAQNYALSPSSPAIGMGCGPSDGNVYPTTLGAVRDGVVIGPTDSKMIPARSIGNLQMTVSN